MKETKFRNIILKSGTQILLGKDENQNETLMNQFKGKKNTIFHTANPGSPFCIINILDPSPKDIKEAATYCARYSQDWRDNKRDVKIHRFTGENVYKRKRMKKGTFGVKNYKIIKIKKEDVENFI